VLLLRRPLLLSSIFSTMLWCMLLHERPLLLLRERRPLLLLLLR
jgi:hypothetical protein